MVNENNNLHDFGDAGEEKVALMLGSLKRVEAPGDFDFRVRSRIAQGRPTRARMSWIPSLARVAAPAMMLAAVGGYFGYEALYSRGGSNGAEVVDASPIVDAPVVTPTTSEVATAPVPAVDVASVKSRVNTAETIATAPKKDASVPVKKLDEPIGGSGEWAVRQTNSIRLETENVETTGDSRSLATLSVLEVFSAMGIRARYSGSGWRVSSVSGRAAAAGLMPGDMIDTVNGKAVGENTGFDAKFAGRTLHVKRDGASIQISL